MANRGREGCVTAAGGRPDARESLVTWPGNPDRPVVRLPLGRARAHYIGGMPHFVNNIDCWR